MATPEPAQLPQPMPDDLKERGWKMSRINDGQFRARNDRLGLYSVGLATPEGAIEAARQLGAGKKMIVVGDKVLFQDPEGTPESLVALPIGKRTGELTAGQIQEDTMQPSAASSVVEAEQTDVAPTTTPRPPAANNALVPVEKIRTDGGTQPREQIDQGTIDRYAEDYENGAVFPLIVVFNDGNNYWLASGFHRFFAFRKANPEAAFITVDLRAGTQREAVLFSLGENATHGLFRSNADKRRAVLTLLNDEEWSQMSDNAVASKARVSQPFVSSLRRELSQNVLSDRTGYDDADVVTEDRDETTAVTSQPTTRIGRDGVVRETKNIGRTAARVLAQDDVIPAENDIRVDEDNQDPQGTVAEPPESGPMLAVKETTKADAELWQNGTIELHLRLNPQGKAIPGTAIVSGKHTNTNAVFLSCTAADLQPMPPAIKQIIKMIQEAFENRGKSQPAATKPKKKTTVARGKKKVTKRTAKPSPKKKPTTRAKQKTRVKARKK